MQWPPHFELNFLDAPRISCEFSKLKCHKRGLVELWGVHVSEMTQREGRYLGKSYDDGKEAHEAHREIQRRCENGWSSKHRGLHVQEETELHNHSSHRQNAWCGGNCRSLPPQKGNLCRIQGATETANIIIHPLKLYNVGQTLNL